MSKAWQGFTEEDIKLMNGIQTQSTEKNPPRNLAKRSISDGKKKIIYKSASDLKKPSSEEYMLEEGRLSATRDSQLESENNGAPASTMNNTDGESEMGNEETPSINLPTLKETQNMTTVCLKIKSNVDYEIVEKEMKITSSSLTDFHFRQKLMEEQNRKRKELLAKALADRKKKTHAEAHRLQAIQEELQKLDHLLSNDISILRNQIEAACLEFAEAQKKYDKVEKEYLEAKVILFSKMERKELLTGHLCTIIEQNEIRKAKKLSELMEKLEIVSMVPEEGGLLGTLDPPYRCSDSMPVGTIKDPKFREKVQESQIIKTSNKKCDKMHGNEIEPDDIAPTTGNH